MGEELPPRSTRVRCVTDPLEMPVIWLLLLRLNRVFLGSCDVDL